MYTINVIDDAKGCPLRACDEAGVGGRREPVFAHRKVGRRGNEMEFFQIGRYSVRLISIFLVQRIFKNVAGWIFGHADNRVICVGD